MKRQADRYTGSATGPVTAFRKPGDREELARLERLTGLAFESVPDSLLSPRHTPADDPETGADFRPEPMSRPARS